MIVEDLEGIPGRKQARATIGPFHAPLERRTRGTSRRYVGRNLRRPGLWRCQITDPGTSSVVEYERGRRLPGVEVVEQYEDHFGLERGTLGAQRERARLERLEDPRDATVDQHLGDVACPYKGLRAFQYEDAALFFGREGQSDALIARLQRSHFLAVVGTSGSGK